MRGRTTIRIHTLGYQGISLQEYIDLLVSKNINIVIDVREHAWSYKRGFSKSPLSKALDAAGIAYHHERSAGNPSANRKTATSIDECLDRYRSFVSNNPGQLAALQQVIRKSHAEGKQVCLTCYEQKPHECHRSIILDFLQIDMPAIKIIHLHAD